MVERMLAKGWHAAQTDLLAGLHDYGQAYGHLASKGFLHARKHAPFVELLAPYWASLGQADADYRALAAGARLGLGHQGAVRVDSRLLAELTAQALETLDLPEPQPLAWGPALAASVQAILADMDADPQRQELQERIFPRHFWKRLDGGGA